MSWFAPTPQDSLTIRCIVCLKAQHPAVLLLCVQAVAGAGLVRQAGPSSIRPAAGQVRLPTSSTPRDAAAAAPANAAVVEDEAGLAPPAYAR